MIKAIYMRMPRCGSTTIGNCFCGKNNIKYFGGHDMGFWREEDESFQENISPQLYKCVSNYVGAEVYNESFVFTSIRNPYSRAVSIYNHRSWNSVETFSDFCDAIKMKYYPSNFAKWHSTNIAEHIIDKDTLKVNFIIKLENIREDLNIVCDKLKIPRQEPLHENKSHHMNKHYTEYYNNKTREIIAERYAKDIELFGYEFGE